MLTKKKLNKKIDGLELSLDVTRKQGVLIAAGMGGLTLITNTVHFIRHNRLKKEMDEAVQHFDDGVEFLHETIIKTAPKPLSEEVDAVVEKVVKETVSQTVKPTEEKTDSPS